MVVALAACSSTAPTTAVSAAPRGTASTPVETPSPTIGEPATTPEFEISNGLDAETITTPEQITQAFSDAIEAWYNDGANQVTSHRLFRGDGQGINPRDFADQVAADSVKKYTALYFVEDWEGNPALVALVGRMEQSNAQAVYDYLMTAGDIADGIAPDPADKEPYYRSSDSTYVSSSTSSDGQVEITSSTHDFGNSSQNRIGEALTANDDWAESTTQSTDTFVIQGSNWRIANTSGIDN
jgi:hypothetical protein